MKTPQERTQQAVEMVKQKKKVGRKKLYFTEEEVREANSRRQRELRKNRNTLVINYDKIENEEENKGLKESVVAHFRPLLETFVRKYKKTLA